MDRLRRVARVLVALAAAGYLLYWSMFLAVWSGAASRSPGWASLGRSLPTLTISLVVGLAALVVYRWLLDLRVRSRWLWLAFVFPLWQAAERLWG
ncbi:hypothetical protein [Rhizohabitans arisaemae]|uniref:hypothetical protein n=1 Tax=Rhizohabitans arisaemae TaxID=2720610 RepID=UPI0024B2662D|nr:hypothetical protein [Rhizohabitans arisaemae]